MLSISKKKLRLSTLIQWRQEQHTKPRLLHLKYCHQNVNSSQFPRTMPLHRSLATILQSSPIGRMEIKIFTMRDTLNIPITHCPLRETLLTRKTSLRSKWSNWRDTNTWLRHLGSQELPQLFHSCEWLITNLRNLSLRPQTRKLINHSN